MRKNFFKSLLIIPILISTTFCGCNSLYSKLSKNLTNDKAKETSSTLYKRSKEPALSDNSSSISDNISPYTGEKLNDSFKNNTPFMAIVENSKSARPQSGLSKADIIYETLAEGGIPRFLALYYKNKPNKIGPIRSVRPYFLEISKEYNLPLAHCGGSEEALTSIQSQKDFKDIDEIKNSNSFFRDKKLSAPHNLFTSYDKITKYIADKNLKLSPNSSLSFDDEYNKSKDLKACDYVHINQSKYYNTSYSFKDNKYLKFMEDTKAIDSEGNTPLAFNNIVIQIAKTKVIDSIGHVSIELIGKGNGFIISNGKVKEITWKKDDDFSKTQLLDSNGDKVFLSSGNTIWHIVNSSDDISFTKKTS